MNRDIINHKNSAGNKLGVRIVIVLCQLYLKYILNIFIFGYNLSNKLRNHAFSVIYL
jgi:hypothetical protein